MPHLRNRLASKILKKRLNFTPVVAIQGARQTGKSVLARALLKTIIKSGQYVSFDDRAKQTLAQDSPQTFLSSFEGVKTLVIDEAQKAPNIFEAIKLTVDQDRRPGQFLLLGSTEFSHLQNIRESLTGRMGRIRLFPMTLAETLGESGKASKYTRSQCLKYLSTGGMPAIAFVRDTQAQAEFFQDWIDLTCQRDIFQFKRLKLDSDLAYSLLKNSAVLEEPTAAALAKAARENPKKVGSHLKALCELFALTKLDPHPSGTGKSIYLPLDSGIAHHLGANQMRCLHIALLNEKMAANSYAGGKRNSYFYYRSTSKRVIHLLEEELGGKLRAFQLFDREAIKGPDLELLKAFALKNPGAVVSLVAPITDAMKTRQISLMPWESIFS